MAGPFLLKLLYAAIQEYVGITDVYGPGLGTARPTPRQGHAPPTLPPVGLGAGVVAARLLLALGGGQPYAAVAGLTWQTIPWGGGPANPLS